MSYRDKRHKTAEAHDWSHTILHYLSQEEPKQALKELREYFNPKQHAYKLDLTFYYPNEILHTKDGRISAKSHDISNIEKPLIDLIFLPKYFDQTPPYGAENLKIDDKYIIEMTSRKKAATEHGIEVEMEIINLDQL